MSTTKTGRTAEAAAAKFLEEKGYEVSERNWRTPACEIDIVASRTQRRGLFKKNRSVYFFEVKYRKNRQHGSGLDYITPAKLAQMRFAAQNWVAQNDWSGPYELGAIEVTGDDFEITEFIPQIDG
jgi:putative endonuclease